MKNKCQDSSHSHKVKKEPSATPLKEMKVTDVREEKIACINLAYANGELIKALIQRTNILNRGRMDRLHDIEGVINKMCTNK
jgi:hypothetical protein